MICLKLCPRIYKQTVKRSDGGTYGPYYRAVIPFPDGGKFKTTLDLKDHEDWKLFVSIDSNYSIAKEHLIRKKKMKQKTRRDKPGRPPALPPVIKAVLIKAGFKVKGTRITRDRHKYLTQDAIQFRFDCLDPELRSIVKDAETLGEICRRAASLLASYRKKKNSKTYNECFQEAFEEILELQ